LKFLRILPIFLILLVLIPSAEDETINLTMEGGMDIEITYPSKAILDRTISISFFGRK